MKTFAVLFIVLCVLNGLLSLAALYLTPTDEWGQAFKYLFFFTFDVVGVYLSIKWLRSKRVDDGKA